MTQPFIFQISFSQFYLNKRDKGNLFRLLQITSCNVWKNEIFSTFKAISKYYPWRRVFLFFLSFLYLLNGIVLLLNFVLLLLLKTLIAFQPSYAALTFCVPGMNLKCLKAKEIMITRANIKSSKGLDIHDSYFFEFWFCK